MKPNKDWGGDPLEVKWVAKESDTKLAVSGRNVPPGISILRVGGAQTKGAVPNRKHSMRARVRVLTPEVIYEISPPALRHFSPYWQLGGRLSRSGRYPDGLELASQAPFSLRLLVDIDASVANRSHAQVAAMRQAELASAANELRAFFKGSPLGHPVLVEPGTAYAQHMVLSRRDRMASARNLAAALEACARARAQRGAVPFRLLVFGYGMKVDAAEFWRYSLLPAHRSSVLDVGYPEANRRWDEKTIDWGATWGSDQLVLSWTNMKAALLVENRRQRRNR